MQAVVSLVLISTFCYFHEQDLPFNLILIASAEEEDIRQKWDFISH